MPVVEVRENGVDTQPGMLGANQHIDYREDARDRCLVELALAVNQIRKDATWKNLKLGPGEFVTAIRSLQVKPGFHCKYRTRRRNQESAYEDAPPKRIAGGLYIIIPGLRNDDLIEVVVEAAGRRWRSDYEPVDAITIMSKIFWSPLGHSSENRVSSRIAEGASIALAPRTGQFAHFRVVTPDSAARR